MSTPFEYQVDQQSEQYIKVSAQGSAGMNEIIFMYQDLCSVAAENGYNKLFIDVTDLVLDFPMTDFVPLMNQLTELLADYKVARLCNVFEFRQDLIENVSGKANLDLKNFTEQSEALAWLLS